MSANIYRTDDTANLERLARINPVETLEAATKAARELGKDESFVATSYGVDEWYKMPNPPRIVLVNFRNNKAEEFSFVDDAPWKPRSGFQVVNDDLGRNWTVTTWEKL
jgi:hypothetical protein